MNRLDSKDMLSPDELSIACLLYQERPMSRENLCEVSYCNSNFMDNILGNLMKRRDIIFKDGLYHSNWSR